MAFPIDFGEIVLHWQLLKVIEWQSHTHHSGKKPLQELCERLKELTDVLLANDACIIHNAWCILQELKILMNTAIHSLIIGMKTSFCVVEPCWWIANSSSYSDLIQAITDIFRTGLKTTWIKMSPTLIRSILGVKPNWWKSLKAWCHLSWLNSIFVWESRRLRLIGPKSCDLQQVGYRLEPRLLLLPNFFLRNDLDGRKE